MIYNVAVSHPAGGDKNAIHLLGNSTLKNVEDFLFTIQRFIEPESYIKLKNAVKSFYEREGFKFFEKKCNYQMTVIQDDVRIAFIRV